jgi:hypothetical protein
MKPAQKDFRMYLTVTHVRVSAQFERLQVSFYVQRTSQRMEVPRFGFRSLSR